MWLIAVRHGETIWNAEGKELGQLDSPLSERGVRQAEALAHRLSTMNIDALYSSDLGRAIRTAEIIGTACQKPVQLDRGLRERNMGVFQGLTQSEIAQKYPHEFALFEQKGFYDAIPDGETAQQRLERGTGALTTIAKQYTGQTVAVVTHGGILTGFLEFILEIPLANGRRFNKHHGNFNSFEYVDDRWRLETWNDVSHLQAGDARS